MNNYQQIKVLGEGGFGKAILVKQRSTGNTYVIKEVRLTALSQKDRNEATKEAKVLASLKHPNIVNYINSFQERGCFYIVMEYCDGGDLAKKIASRGSVLFPEEEILHYFIQVSLAIKYIHDRKILHRDLKAQNIFLTKDGTAKLGDFGIARVLEHTFQLCRTQIGTPYYLSPEICEGKNYNSKTDIWSLGCILYELCTLKRAFEGCDQRGILMKIVRGKYTPISSKYSQDLRDLVDAMLTKEANKRPTINDILKRPFIQKRLSSMLEKTILDYEFSHTIIHGRKPFSAPTVIINKSSSENNNQNLVEKGDQNQIKKQNDSLQNEKNRPTSEQRLIDQNFLKEQQHKKQQQIQIQQRQQPQNKPQNYPANVDPRYARRNYDIYGNARNPKQQEEQERERQKQIEDLKRRHQQDEKERREREQKQQQFQQQLDQEREKRAKQREIDEYKRIAAEREKQKIRLEQQKKELEEMKRLAAEQNRIEEEKRRASMEELRRQEEEYRKRREEAKRIMRNHEKEEERKQAEEFERRRLEEVERKRKEVEEMVKRRQAEADELKRIQEQKRKERLMEQQREREKLEADRRRIAEEEKARRRAVMQKQRELREIQKRDQDERRKRQLQDLHQNAIVNNRNNNQIIKQSKNQTFIDNDYNENDIRGGFSYNDSNDPLEQTTADIFISKISQDGPAWAKMPQKRIPISLDQTIRVSDNEDNDNSIVNDEENDEFASVQKDAFFDSCRSGSIKKINNDNKPPSWAKSDNEKTDSFVEDTLNFTFIDSVPAWAQKNNQNNGKQTSASASRLLPERLTKQNANNNNNDDDDDEVDKEVDKQMNKKFMEEDDNKLSSLHDLAMSIKQALDIPDEKKNDVDDNEMKNEEQIFFMNDEQIRLPVANDKKSLAQRQDAIRTLLEEKIGVETFIALNEELINKEADDNAPTPIISNLPPGIVCLAQQWLMLDATSKDQN